MNQVDGVGDIMDQSLSCVFDDCETFINGSGLDESFQQDIVCILFTRKSVEYLRIYSKHHLNMLLDKLITWWTNRTRNTIADQKDQKELALPATESLLLVKVDIAFTQAVLIAAAASNRSELHKTWEHIDDTTINIVEERAVSFFSRHKGSFIPLSSTADMILHNKGGGVISRVKSIFGTGTEVAFDCPFCEGMSHAHHNMDGHAEDLNRHKDILLTNWMRVISRISTFRAESVSSRLENLIKEHLHAHESLGFIARQSKLSDDALEEIGRMMEGYRQFRLEMVTITGTKVAINLVKTLHDLIKHPASDSFLRCRTAITLTGMLYPFSHFSYPVDVSFLDWFHVLLDLFDTVLAWGQRKRTGGSVAIVRNAVCPLLGCILSAFCAEHFHQKFNQVFDFLKICYKSSETRNMAMFCMNHVLGIYLMKISGGRIDTPMDKVDSVVKTFLMETAKLHKSDHDRMEGLEVEKGWVSIVLTVCEWNPIFGIEELIGNRLLESVINMKTIPLTMNSKHNVQYLADEQAKQRTMIVGLRALIAFLHLCDVQKATNEEDQAFESLNNLRTKQLLACRELLITCDGENSSIGQLLSDILLKYAWVMDTPNIQFKWTHSLETPILSQTSSYHQSITSEDIETNNICIYGKYTDDVSLRIFILAIQCLPDIWPSNLIDSVIIPLLIKASLHSHPTINAAGHSAIMRLMKTSFSADARLTKHYCEMCARVTVLNEVCRQSLHLSPPVGTLVDLEHEVQTSNQQDNAISSHVLGYLQHLHDILGGWIHLAQTNKSKRVYYYSSTPFDIQLAASKEDKESRKSIMTRIRHFFSAPEVQMEEKKPISSSIAPSHVCNRVDIHLAEAVALLWLSSLSPKVRLCCIQILEHTRTLCNLYKPVHHNQNYRDGVENSLASIKLFIEPSFLHIVDVLELSPLPVVFNASISESESRTREKNLDAWKQVAVTSSCSLSASDLFHVDDDNRANSCYAQFWVWSWGHLLRSLVLLSPHDQEEKEDIHVESQEFLLKHVTSQQRAHVRKTLERVRAPVWRFLGDLFLIGHHDTILGEKEGIIEQNDNAKKDTFLFSAEGGTPALYHGHIRVLVQFSLFVVIIDPLFTQNTSNMYPSFARLLEHRYLPLRSVGAFALGNVHWKFAPVVFEVVRSLEHTLGNAVQSKNAFNSNTNKKMVDSVRTHIAFIYRLQALYLPSKVLRESGFVRERFIHHMYETHACLNGDHEYRWDITDLRIVFCIVVRRLIEASYDIPDAYQETHYFETAFRKELFEFLISWCGHGPSNQSFYDRCVAHKNIIIKKMKRDGRKMEEKTNYLIQQVENSFQKKLLILQCESLKCMSSLLKGELFDHDVRLLCEILNKHHQPLPYSQKQKQIIIKHAAEYESQHSFVYPWFASLLSDPRQNISDIGYWGLEGLIATNPELFPQFIDLYFEIETPVAIGIVLVLGGLIIQGNCAYDKHVALEKLLNLLVFTLGDASYEVRSMAVGLLPVIHSKLNSVPFTIYISSHVPRIYCNVQKNRSSLLAEQFSSDDGFLHLFLFEALRTFHLCCEIQSQRRILEYIIPWLTRINIGNEQLFFELLKITMTHEHLTSEIEQVWRTIGSNRIHMDWFVKGLITRVAMDDESECCMESIRTVALVLSDMHPTEIIHSLVKLNLEDPTKSQHCLMLLADIAYMMDWSTAFSQPIDLKKQAYEMEDSHELSFSTLAILLHTGLSGIHHSDIEIAHYCRTILINCIHAVAFTCRKTTSTRKGKHVDSHENHTQVKQQHSHNETRPFLSARHPSIVCSTLVYHTLDKHRSLYLDGQEQAASLIRYINSLGEEEMDTELNGIIDHILTLIGKVSGSEFAHCLNSSSIPTHIFTKWLIVSLSWAISDYPREHVILQSHIIFRSLLMKSSVAFLTKNSIYEQFNSFASSILSSFEGDLRLVSLLLNHQPDKVQLEMTLEHMQSMENLCQLSVALSPEQSCPLEENTIMQIFWLGFTALECRHLLHLDIGRDIFKVAFGIVVNCFNMLSQVHKEKHYSKKKNMLSEDMLRIGVLESIVESPCTKTELVHRLDRGIEFVGLQQVITRVLYMSHTPDIAMQAFSLLSYLSPFWAPLASQKFNTAAVELFGLLDAAISSSPLLGLMNNIVAQLPWICQAVDSGDEKALGSTKQLSELCDMYELDGISTSLSGIRDMKSAQDFLENVMIHICKDIPAYHCLVLAAIACGTASSAMALQKYDEEEGRSFNHLIRQFSLSILATIIKTVHWRESGITLAETKFMLNRINTLMGDMFLFEQACEVLALALDVLDYRGVRKAEEKGLELKEDAPTVRPPVKRKGHKREFSNLIQRKEEDPAFENISPSLQHMLRPAVVKKRKAPQTPVFVAPTPPSEQEEEVVKEEVNEEEGQINRYQEIIRRSEHKRMQNRKRRTELHHRTMEKKARNH